MLVTLSKLLAPIIPFATEAIYQNLVVRAGLGQESVHLDDYPVADESVIDSRLTDVSRLAMRLSSMGRAARSKASIKVRQPLATAMIKTRTAEERSLLEQAGPQIIDELNVRDIVAFDAQRVIDTLIAG